MEIRGFTYYFLRELSWLLPRSLHRDDRGMGQARTISFRLLFTLIRFINVLAIDRRRRLIAKTFMKRISAINRRVRSIAKLAINRKGFFMKRGPDQTNPQMKQNIKGTE